MSQPGLTHQNRDSGNETEITLQKAKQKKL